LIGYNSCRRIKPGEGGGGREIVRIIGAEKFAGALAGFVETGEVGELELDPGDRGGSGGKDTAGNVGVFAAIGVEVADVAGAGVGVGAIDVVGAGSPFGGRIGAGRSGVDAGPAAGLGTFVGGDGDAVGAGVSIGGAVAGVITAVNPTRGSRSGGGAGRSGGSGRFRGRRRGFAGTDTVAGGVLLTN
jgi:hypothetical protein